MALDPTHIAATTSAIATVIFSKALEKGGEHVGDAVYQKVGQLVQAVREKFQQQGSLETLTEAQGDPTEQNISDFTQELADLMLEDEQFAADIEHSLAIFAKDVVLEKILVQQKLNHAALSSQPLNVEQFKDPDEISEPIAEPKPSLKVQPDAQNIEIS